MYSMKILHYAKCLILIILAVMVLAASSLTLAYAKGKPKQSSFEYKKYTEHEEYREALFWKMNGVYRRSLIQ